MRPFIAAILAGGAALVLGLAVLLAWFALRSMKHRRMRVEFDESRLVRLTECGDQLLAALAFHEDTHGRLPMNIDELDLTPYADCMAESARYGTWDIPTPSLPGQIALRITLHPSWRDATDWLRISVAHTPTRPGAWCAVRATPASVFSEDVHQLRGAIPKRDTVMEHNNPRSTP